MGEVTKDLTLREDEEDLNQEWGGKGPPKGKSSTGRGRGREAGESVVWMGEGGLEGGGWHWRGRE